MKGSSGPEAMRDWTLPRAESSKLVRRREAPLVDAELYRRPESLFLLARHRPRDLVHPTSEVKNAE